MKKYKALKRLFLTSTKTYAEPGTEVDLSHLTDEQIEVLKAKDAVESLSGSRSEQETAKTARKSS